MPGMTEMMNFALCQGFQVIEIFLNINITYYQIPKTLNIFFLFIFQIQQKFQREFLILLH